MKALEIITPHKFTDRQELARAIASNWETIDRLRDGVVESGNQWLCEVRLQGQRLLQLKDTLPHGQWLPWCEANLGRRARQAREYMRLAGQAGDDSKLAGAANLQQALARCSEKEPIAATQADKPALARPWPASRNVAAKKLCRRWLEALQRDPLADCSEAILNAYRADLLPVATVLWPEKFL